MLIGFMKGTMAVVITMAGFSALCYIGAVYASPVEERVACITQEELDAEYTALGTYEIQVDEFCEL